jgi:hypothetical protein
VTKTYAARRLLEHGPLSMRDFHAITGWPYTVARKVISYLQQVGEIVNEAGAWMLA